MCGVTEEEYIECFDWFDFDYKNEDKTKSNYIKWIQSFANILDENIFNSVVEWVFNDNCLKFRHSKFVDGIDILHFYKAIKPIKEELITKEMK